MAVGVERFGAVTFLDGAVEFRMGFGQSGWHGERVVKIGERAEAARRQMRFARGQDTPCFFLHAFALFGGWTRPFEQQVRNDLARILITTFKTSACIT